MAAVPVSMSRPTVAATSANLRPISTHRDASFSWLSAAHSHTACFSPFLHASSAPPSAAAALSAAAVVPVLAAKGGPKKNFKKAKKPASDSDTPAVAAGEAGDAEGKAAAKAPKATKVKKESSSMKGRPAVDFTTEAMTDGSITVRVDVAGSETATLFDGTLRSLAKECPPLPGARLGKGGRLGNGSIRQWCCGSWAARV
ncbi:hypothetical protein CLOM_g1377 [Closterium sp. NIES-68]|nr:hypothetical protein CLOM_g1377 [Closterium sp. NIES-68]GJP86140.1 hypothetical protein CLOP_g16204 [Closterium sp. NIES-67]